MAAPSDAATDAADKFLVDIQIRALLWPPREVERHVYTADTLNEAMDAAATLHVRLAATGLFERVAWVHFPAAMGRKPLKVTAKVPMP